METCFGCHSPVPEGITFCKTCEDRRKVLPVKKLSDPRVLTPSANFEGFTDPKTGEVISNGIN